MLSRQWPLKTRGNKRDDDNEKKRKIKRKQQQQKQIQKNYKYGRYYSNYIMITLNENSLNVPIRDKDIRVDIKTNPTVCFL